MGFTSALLHKSELQNVEGLLARLRAEAAGASGPGTRILDLLSRSCAYPHMRDLIVAGSPTARLVAALNASVLQFQDFVRATDFNSTGDPMTVGDFAGVMLPVAAQKLWTERQRRALTGPETELFNRLVLQACYPPEFVPLETPPPLSALLQESDILDGLRFMGGLNMESVDLASGHRIASPSQRVMDLLPGDIRTMVRNFLVFIPAMNEVLARSDLYQPTDFQPATGEAANLLARGVASLSLAEVVKLNRLLIEAEYPDFIAPSDHTTPADPRVVLLTNNHVVVKTPEEDADGKTGRAAESAFRVVAVLGPDHRTGDQAGDVLSGRCRDRGAHARFSYSQSAVASGGHRAVGADSGVHEVSALEAYVHPESYPVKKRGYMSTLTEGKVEHMHFRGKIYLEKGKGGIGSKVLRALTRDQIYIVPDPTKNADSSSGGTRARWCSTPATRWWACTARATTRTESPVRSARFWISCRSRWQPAGSIRGFRPCGSSARARLSAACHDPILVKQSGRHSEDESR